MLIVIVTFFTIGCGDDSSGGGSNDVVPLNSANLKNGTYEQNTGGSYYYDLNISSTTKIIFSGGGSTAYTVYDKDMNVISSKWNETESLEAGDYIVEIYFSSFYIKTYYRYMTVFSPELQVKPLEQLVTKSYYGKKTGKKYYSLNLQSTTNIDFSGDGNSAYSIYDKDMNLISSGWSGLESLDAGDYIVGIKFISLKADDRYIYKDYRMSVKIFD